MAKTISPLLPATAELLLGFGERLRLARLRRRLSSKQVAQRAGMAPMTLRSLERGGSGVTIGAYLAVMQVLGLERDLDLLGKADPLGRELQDSRLPAARTAVAARTAGAPQSSEAKSHRRGADPSATVDVVRAAGDLRHAQARKPPVGQGAKPADDASAWMVNSGFTSSRDLAELINPAARVPKKSRRH